MSSRNYVFTLNNYTTTELELLQTKPDFVKYAIWGFETGEHCNTPHLQGYVELNESIRYTALQKSWVALKRARFDKRKGTREQARNYCMKGDQPHEEWISLDAHGEQLRERGPSFGLNAQYDEIGSWKYGGQGARNDLNKFVDRLYAGEQMKTIARSEPLTYCKFRAGLKDFQGWAEYDLAHRYRTMSVNVIWGAAGVGKSRQCFDYDSKIPFCIATLLSEQFPLNAYDGEPIIILDDFYGQIKFSELLRMLDGHKYAINTKGGMRYALYTTVYITANRAPETWYKNVDKELQKALLRRLTSVKHIDDNGVITDYKIPIIEVSDDTPLEKL